MKPGGLLTLKFGLHVVKHTVESEFSKFMIEYLGENETEFESTLVGSSGAWINSNNERLYTVAVGIRVELKAVSLLLKELKCPSISYFLAQLF